MTDAAQLRRAVDAVSPVTLDSFVLMPPLPALLSILLVVGLIGLGAIACRALPAERRGLEERAAVTLLVIAVLAAVVHGAALVGCLSLPAVRVVGWGLAALGGVTAWSGRGAVVRGLSAALDAVRRASPSRRLLLGFLGTAGASMVLVSLGPATDADSLDYHLGVPLEWLRHGRGTLPDDWYHARLVGLGEMLDLLGLATGTDGLGAVLSASAALLLAAVAGRASRTGGDPLLGAAMVLGCPVVLFLASTQKPALLPAACLTVALALLVRRWAAVDALDLVLILGLVSFAASFKHSYVLTAGPLVVAALVAAARAGRIAVALGALAAWGGLLLLPILFRNVSITGDPIWPFLAAIRDGPTSSAARFALLLREPGGDPRLLTRLLASVATLDPGRVSQPLGLGVLVALAASVRREARPFAIPAGAACLLLLVLGQPSPRFFLEPYLWMSLAVAAVPWGRAGSGMRVLLGTEVAVVALMGVVLAARLLPGAVLPSKRAEILRRDASGRAVAEWLASTAGGGEGLLTGLRSRAFLAGMVGIDPIVYASSRVEAYREFVELLDERHVRWMAFPIEEAVNRSAACQRLAGVESRSFPRATRNPLSRGGEERWILSPVPEEEAGRRTAFACFFPVG